MHFLKFLSGTSVLLATKGFLLEQSNEEIREVPRDIGPENYWQLL